MNLIFSCKMSSEMGQFKMDNEKYHVEVSRASSRKFSAHVAFLARVHNAAAWRLHNEILTDIRSLEGHPSRYPKCESKGFPDRDLHQKSSSKRYQIVFAIQESEKLVTVVDIQDCRQDSDKNLAQSVKSE